MPKKTPAYLSMQSEIEDMIWEVDEDCDEKVDWEEFQSMYERCRNDKTGENRLSCPSNPGHFVYCVTLLSLLEGTEPKQLFNVVQFIIHDVGNTGKVTLEEAMKLTYLRFGRVSFTADRTLLFCMING